MTAFRLIPLPIHAALRMATGLLTIAVPFIVGFSAAAAVVSIVLGAVVAGVALSGLPDERGRTPIRVSTLHAFDYGTVIGLLAGALIIATAGADPAAGLTLGLIASAQLVGNLTTRYSLGA